jgi:hypothetical protein
MPPAKNRYRLFTATHSEKFCNFLPAEAAEDQIQDECGTMGRHPFDCCPQLIQLVLALEPGLIIERIDKRPVPIAEEDVETSTKPSVAASKILRSPTRVRSDSPVRFSPELLAVVSPLRMDRYFRQFRHSPYISDSLAREFAQILGNRDHRLEPLPGNAVTVGIGIGNANRHKTAPVAVGLEIEWNCHNRHFSSPC